MSYRFLNILDHGAVPDGETLATTAIQNALDAAHRAGGGTVLVPPGTFLSGTIFLKSHTELHLAPGAVLLGSPKLEDYTAVRWGHHNDRTPWHLVMAHEQEDIAITGRGRIQGNGPAFWQKERAHEHAFFREITLRPSPMVEIDNCRDVLIENVQITDSPGWALHLYDTDRAQIRGVRIETNLLGPNSDGIDLTGVHEVTVSDCHVTSGDDAIALKTTPDSRTCQYVTVTNCVLETNCVAVRLGFENHRDFEDITVSNCVIKRCSRAIDLRAVANGDIRRVVISGITGTTNCGWGAARPIELTSAALDDLFAHHTFEGHPNYGKPLPAHKPGIIEDVTLRDIEMVTDGRVILASEKPGDIRNVTIDNLHLRYAYVEDPSYLDGLPLRTNPGFLPMIPEPRPVPAAFIAYNVANLKLRDYRLTWPTYPVPAHWEYFRSRHCPHWGDEAKLEALRTGAERTPFHAFWAKHCSGLAEVEGLSAHGNDMPAQVISDCRGLVTR